MARDHKKRKRGKHIPQRTCVGCRKVEPKRNLIRLVRTPEGVRIQSQERLAGRGAYLHDQRYCWERGLGGALAQSLKTEITAAERENLEAFMQELPPEEITKEEV